MNIIPFLVACSLLLVAGSIIMFVYSIAKRDHEHYDRLGLLPLNDDDPKSRKREQAGTKSDLVEKSEADSEEAHRPSD